MTQTATDHTPTTLGLRSVPLSELHEWPGNPRVTHDPAAHTTLVESIRADGLLQPLLVRPRRVDAVAAPGYEVIAGNRRLRALSEIGGDPLVPVLVRDLDDDDALAAAIKENGDRDGLAPLEEARAFAELVKRGGAMGVVQAAALTGKSEQHIRQRLRLLDLCPAAQAFLAAGGLTLGGALLLAQLRDHADQASALEDAGYLVDEVEGTVAERLPQDGLPTMAQWRQIVGNQGRRLSRAPFPISLAVLTQAGACAACPKRSDAQGSLFADATEGVCLDRACWDEKVLANDRRLLDEAERTGRLLTLERTSKIWQSWGDRPGTLHNSEWQTFEGLGLVLSEDQRKQVRVAVDSNGHAREVLPLALFEQLTANAGDDGDDSSDEEEQKAKRKEAQEAYMKKRAEEAAAQKARQEIEERVGAEVLKVLNGASMNDEGTMTAIAVGVAFALGKHRIAGTLAGVATGDMDAALERLREMDADATARWVLKVLVEELVIYGLRDASAREVLTALGGESYDQIVARVTAPPKKSRKRAGTAASVRAEQEGGAA